MNAAFTAALERLRARAAQAASVAALKADKRVAVSPAYRDLVDRFDERLNHWWAPHVEPCAIARELLAHFEAADSAEAQTITTALRAVARANLKNGISYAVLRAARDALPLI